MVSTEVLGGDSDSSVENERLEDTVQVMELGGWMALEDDFGPEFKDFLVIFRLNMLIFRGVFVKCYPSPLLAGLGEGNQWR